MKTMFTIDLAILLALGFVPNQRNRRYHTARATIGGHTVWCKDFHHAVKIANRVVGALYKQGMDVRYRVEDEFDNTMYNW